tara:strand:- start:7728 stop:8126 length:399 start_codon:yes stop_codon:yes gene_type:complete
MKKISILLLAVFYIGIANLSAQDATTEAATTTEAVTASEETKEECGFTKNDEGQLVCVKTGKVCNSTCPKKASKTCCKGKKAKEGSFNFNKSNNYSGKSSCSKSAKKACCKKKAKKAEDTEAAPTEEASSEE